MRRDKHIIAVVVLIAAALAAWVVLRDDADARNRIDASGTVEATEADLGFKAGGRIAGINVREGDFAQQGETLARLVQDELAARRAAARAQLDVAQALLAELQRGARPEEERQAQAAVEAARRRMQEAQSRLNRTRKLYEGGAVSREALEHAETVYAVARAEAEQAEQQLEIVSSGPRAERIEAQRGVVRQAEAALAQANALLDDAVIVAPFGGVVTVRHREPGESVAPGLPVVTLLNPRDRWVRIYVREDQIGRVRIGQSASIRSDSHPDKRFAGRVSFISSQAEFTPRNVQTAAERVKLVYAVKVAIIGDAENALKPGVPADVSLR
ncbi:MAG: HlyD family secretion protein [Gemmatimonadota bacterium]